MPGAGLYQPPTQTCSVWLRSIHHTRTNLYTYYTFALCAIVPHFLSVTSSIVTTVCVSCSYVVGPQFSLCGPLFLSYLRMTKVDETYVHIIHDKHSVFAIIYSPDYTM
jgi:hypothetical protein